MIQVSAPDITLVHEEILISSGFTCRLWFADKPINIEIVRIFLYSHQFGIMGIAQYLHNALFQAAFFQVHQLLSIVAEGEEDGREGQRHSCEFVYDMPHFGGIALKEIPSGRYIKEKVL